MASAAEPAAAQPVEATPSEAQPSGGAPDEADVARARALFSEGVSHTQAQRWDEAAGAFQAALALRDAPPIRYNLAAALVELGRFREALEQVESVLASSHPPANIRALAQALEERIDREAGRLRVETSEEDAEVSVDLERMPAAWRARPMPVTPGSHRVTLSRGAETLAEEELDVEAGALVQVRLVPRGGQLGSPVPLEEDWRLWVGVGAGALALVTLVSILAASAGGEAAPVTGNFNPGVLTW